METLRNSAFAFVADRVFGGLFGGNGCDRTCKDRQAAHNWCKAQSWCFEDIQGVREKFRKRAALAILEATQSGLDYSVDKRGVTIYQPIPGNGAHEELIEKAKNRETTCGPGGRCIVYGYKQVVRVTNDSRDVWHDISDDDWVSVWPIPLPKGIRKPSPSIETATQTGHVEQGYEVGVQYHQSVVMDGVVVSQSTIDTSWTGEIKWQDTGVAIDRRRWRVCAPGGKSCLGGE